MTQPVRIALTALLLLAEPFGATVLAAGAAHCGSSVTPLAFGQYIPFAGSPSDFTATLTVTCTASGTSPVPVQGTIALLGGAGGIYNRRMTSGTRSLRYQLYSDPARSILWGATVGDGAVALSGVVGPNNTLRQTIPVYGRILARQSDVATGNYTDHIIVELNY